VSSSGSEVFDILALYKSDDYSSSSQMSLTSSLPLTCSTRADEIDNSAAWAAENNLKLNKSKTKEVIFRDNKRGNLKTLPPPFPGITRDSLLKILGAAFSSNLSA